MVELVWPCGTVYILENAQVQRVKVGMTGIGVNDVVDRLKDINDMWLERKVTCQICAGRLVNVGGRVPQHVKSGIRCPGGGALPLERDVSLAESHLHYVASRLVELSGSEKGSAVRIVTSLKKRVKKYRHHQRPVGEWKFRVAFYLYSDGVSQVELLTHSILAKHLDRLAPFGEVFNCSVSEATQAVETALTQLGLGDSTKKEFKLR